MISSHLNLFNHLLLMLAMHSGKMYMPPSFSLSSNVLDSHFSRSETHAIKQGPVVRKVDSAIHWIVLFSTLVNMLKKL